MKRQMALILLICLLAGTAARAETGLERFAVKHGDPTSPKIAITMDDVWETEWVWKTVELCAQYGIHVTFFPCGVNLKPEDRDQWCEVLEQGHEIGCHSYYHDKFKNEKPQNLTARLARFQEALDAALGFHYATRWFRPPFGDIVDEDGKNISAYKGAKGFGYDHALLWTVSSTNADTAFSLTRNGAILLFHARRTDYECLVSLIPRLLEAGFEPVTVSDLFGFDPPEAGGEPYVRSVKQTP